jgi:hypothetical protein
MMRSARNYFCALALTALAFSCQEKEKPKEAEAIKQPVQKKEVWKPAFYGNPDLPVSDSSISSAGIGNVAIGSNLDSLKNKYSAAYFYWQVIYGVEWPAAKINLGNNEWIIASGNHAIGTITSIRTNSKKMYSKNGNHAGMLITELVNQDSIGIDKEERAFILYGEGVEFKIDEASEKTFFRSKQPSVRNLNPKARIREMLVRCGDC